MNIVVLGAGAWGTALAIALARTHAVTLWARDADLCVSMGADRENRRYLPGSIFPESLKISADFPGATQVADLALIATPLAGLRGAVQRLHREAPALSFLWLCKGIEVGSGLLPHQVVAEAMPAGRVSCGMLSGPSFAEEVARGLPTAATLASADAAFARSVAQVLSGTRLRIYASEDIVGVEVGGAVKNVLAIAAGISDGLGLGLNARAALITRGLAEVVRLGVALGARTETLMGLAGMGDLILTSTGDLSRNRRVGLALAAGKSLDEIVKSLGHVAEGVLCAREVMRHATTLNVAMPIVESVCAVLDGKLTAAGSVELLMGRPSTDEWVASQA